MRVGRSYKPVEALYPFLGIDKVHPSTALGTSLSPASSNIIYKDGIVQKRKGYTGMSNIGYGQVPIGVVEFETFTGTKKLLAFSKEYQFLYDSTTEHWQGFGKQLFSCDSGWTAESNVTVTHQTTGHREGTGYLYTVIASGFTTGKAAYSADLGAAVDATGYTHLAFWLYTNSVMAADKIHITLTEDSNGAETTVWREFNIPAITPASQWHYVVLSGDSGDAWASLDAVLSLGIWVDVDQGAVDFWIDDVRLLTSTKSIWTGDEDDTFDHVETMTSSAATIYVTNGKDGLFKWTGSEDEFADVDLDATAEISNFNFSKCLGFFEEHLLLASVDLSGSVGLKDLYHSDTGSYEAFTGTGSGSVTLTDLKGEIKRILPLGESYAIYSEDSIIRADHVGGSSVFKYSLVHSSSNLASGRAIVNLGPYHVYLSLDGFYLFDGFRKPTHISTRVYSDVTNTINKQYASRAWAYNDTNTRRVWFVIPTNTESLDTYYLLEYDDPDPRNWKWSKGAFTDNLFAMGKYSLDSALTWSGASSLGTTWSAWADEWDMLGITQGYPAPVTGDTNGKMYVLDESNQQDDDGGVTATWESADFTVPVEYRSVKGRWGGVELELLGTSVDISYSTDLGSSYTTAQSSQSLTNSWTRYSIPFDVIGESCRIKIVTTAGTDHFRLRWLRLWVKPSGVS